MTTIIEKLAKAKKAMGTHWVLHPRSTYPAKRREPCMCATLRQVVAGAVKDGRI